MDDGEISFNVQTDGSIPFPTGSEKVRLPRNRETFSFQCPKKDVQGRLSCVHSPLKKVFGPTDCRQTSDIAEPIIHVLWTWEILGVVAF